MHPAIARDYGVDRIGYLQARDHLEALLAADTAPRLTLDHGTCRAWLDPVRTWLQAPAQTGLPE